MKKFVNTQLWLLAVLSLALLTSCRNKLPEGYTLPALPVIPANEVSLTDFGAVPDGTTLCTDAFVQALSQLEAMGGGTLQVPAGQWLTGPIVLGSHICLNVQEGATVLFCPELPLYATRDELFGTGENKHQAPICAFHATDIAITGRGVIDGGGDHWRPVRKEYATDEEWVALVADTVNGVLNENQTRWMPIRQDERAYCEAHPIEHRGEGVSWIHYKEYTRPENLWLYECERVLIEGVTFQNSPMWNLHPELCRDLTLRQVTSKNEWFATNGDGLDMESCSHVYVTDCTFDVGDDAICLKSGADEAGRLRGRPTEEVLVEDCRVFHAHGGFVVGSEMSGGVRNVWVRRCAFEGTDSGLRFKTNRQRGGLVENIYVEDVSMYKIKADALLFDMYYHGQSPVLEEMQGHSISDTLQVEVSESTPCFRGIHFKDLYCIEVGRTFYFDGLRESPVQDITLQNVNSWATSPSLFSECQGIKIENLYLDSRGNQEVYMYHADGIDADPDSWAYLKDL